MITVGILTTISRQGVGMIPKWTYMGMIPKWTYVGMMGLRLTMAQMCSTPGFPCETTVQTLPNQCPMYSSTLGTGATSISDCRCSPGAYKTGTSDGSGNGCILCSPGTFMNATGATACQVCPVGFYMDMPGSPFCWECPMGALMRVTGATNNSVCVPPLWTVRLVIPYQNWTVGEMQIAITLIANGLGISNPRITILSTTRRRGLLSSMMTIEVGCSSQADADAIAGQLTPDFMRTVFANSDIPAPIGIISVVVVGNQVIGTSPPTPGPLTPGPLTTPRNPSDTPVPPVPGTDNPINYVMVASISVSILGFLTVLLVSYKYWKPTKITPQGTEIRVKIPRYLLKSG